jgi:hypothetical protein
LSLGLAICPLQASSVTNARNKVDTRSKNDVNSALHRKALSCARYSAAETPRLITPHEAFEQIGRMLVQNDADPKQHLLRIAGVAIAAIIALDGLGTEVEDIPGLQECVNCSLIVAGRQ